jgi:hypothetical protein
VTFFDDSHSYYIGGHKVKTSVTSYISKFFPKFNSLVKAEQEVMKGSKSKYYPMTAQDIVFLWDENGRQSMEQGKEMHKLIERHFKKDLKENEYSVTLAQYLNWLVESGNTQLESEFIVYNPENDIAGSIDGIYKTRDNKLKLVDFKRIESIDTVDKYEHRTAYSPITDLENCNGEKYFLQLNMYKYMLERFYGVKIDSMCLLLLHPNKNKYEEVVVPDRQEHIRRILDVQQELPWGYNGNPLMKGDN